MMSKEEEFILKPRFIPGVRPAKHIVCRLRTANGLIKLVGGTVAAKVVHKQLVAVHIQHLYSNTKATLNS